MHSSDSLVVFCRLLGMSFCCAQVDGCVWEQAEPRPVDYLIARVRPEQLPDVLLLLTWHAAHESQQAAANAAIALLNTTGRTYTSCTENQALAAAAAMTVARQMLLQTLSAHRAAVTCRAGMSAGGRRPARRPRTSSSASS